MSDDYVDRLRRRGDLFKSEGIADEREQRERFTELREAAQRAGRGGDFDRAARYLLKRIEADRLQGEYAKREINDRLEVFARSDKAYAARHVNEEHAEEVAAAAKEYSVDRWQREIDDDIAGLLVNKADGSARRLTINPHHRLRYTKPLAQDQKGRFGKVQRYRGEGATGQLAKQGSRLLHNIGFAQPEHKRQSASDVALRELKERYGVEVITPEMRRAARRAQQSRASKFVSTGPRAIGAGVKSLFGGLGFIARGSIATRQQSKVERELARLRAERPSDPRVQELEKRRDEITRRNPFARIRGKTWGETFQNLWVFLPKSTWAKIAVFVALVVLALLGPGGLGPGGSLVVGAQIAMGLGASLANALVALLNGGLYIFVGLFYLVSNLVLGIANSFVNFTASLIIGAVRTALPSVPTVQATLGFHAQVPQLSYLATVVNVDIDAVTGARHFNFPQWVAVDYNGHDTGGLIFQADSFQPPGFEPKVRVCSAENVCQDAPLASAFSQVASNSASWLDQVAAWVGQIFNKVVS